MRFNLFDRPINFTEQKTTAGFYLYEDGAIVGENPALAGMVKHLGIKHLSAEEIFSAVMGSVIEESRLLINEAMVSESDIETAIKAGLGWPKGPLTFYADLKDLFEMAGKKQKSEWD